MTILSCDCALGIGQAQLTGQLSERVLQTGNRVGPSGTRGAEELLRGLAMVLDPLDGGQAVMDFPWRWHDGYLRSPGSAFGLERASSNRPGTHFCEVGTSLSADWRQPRLPNSAYRSRRPPPGHYARGGAGDASFVSASPPQSADGCQASRGVRVKRVCFSPQADFVAGAVVAGVGVETLRCVRARRELIVGALPLLFGIHQLVEGFVWLGLRGEVSRGLGDAAKEAYILYAHAVLPAIVPLGFMLLEPDRRRSRVMMAMACVGVLLGAYLLWQVTAYPVGAHEQARCIDYTTHTPNDVPIGLLYIAVTCGPALISSRRYLRWFGLVSLVGAIVTAVVRVDELTSLWCVYVAIVSVLILEHFRRQRASEVYAVSDPAWSS
jgi:hypothetical protein